MPTLVWASYKAIRDKVADVPENWIRGFAAKHPSECRKFASTRNGSMLYRVAAVLDAIERGEDMPDAGIVNHENKPWANRQEGEAK